ncbi:MAG: co-chaperone GroES [Clostridia bacterium]|nr:co-chaperone GroES [Clostridia bacterium]
MKNGYVLIKDIENVETKTASGIIIPSTSGRNRYAEIIAVPEGSKYKVGDTIIKPIGKGTEVWLEGEIYESLKEDFIFGYVELN